MNSGSAPETPQPRAGFSEAATAFRDPLSVTVPDPKHSGGEARYLLVGLSYRGRLVVVAQTGRAYEEA